MAQTEVSNAIRDELGGRISQSYLSQIENGARLHLTSGTRQTLARFFKVHPGYLVDDLEEPHLPIRPRRDIDEKLDLWLIDGAEEFRHDTELSRALLDIAKHEHSRDCLLLLAAMLENKVLIDRRGNVQAKAIDERVKQEVQTVFRAGPAVPERASPFPSNSGQVPDRAALVLVVMAPDRPFGEPTTLKFVDQIVREHGASARTFKSALLFAVPDAPGNLVEAARTALAPRVAVAGPLISTVDRPQLDIGAGQFVRKPALDRSRARRALAGTGLRCGAGCTRCRCRAGRDAQTAACDQMAE